MLQKMNEYTKSWLFMGVMGILALSFVFWGIGDIFRSNLATKAVAKIGKVEITVQFLEQMFNQSLVEARKTRGNELTPAQARAAGMLDKTLNNLIEEALFNQEATRLGVNLSDRTVFARYRSMPQFIGKDGKFNINLWEQMISRSGLSEKTLIESERQSSMRRILFESLTAGSNLPDLVRDNMYMARGQKRILEVLSIKNDSVAETAQPSDADLQEVYKNNAKKFTAPEYRAMTIALLSPQQAVKDAVISEDEMKAAYETRKAEFTHAEQRDIMQIIVQSEDKARDLAETLKNTKDFSKDAKAKGYTAVPVSKLDEKSVFQQLYASVFSMEVGDVSDPIKTDMGWHIVQVKKIYPAGVEPFDDVKEDLRKGLAQDKSDDFITHSVNKLDEELAANHSLEEIADSMKLRLVKIQAVTDKGVQEDGKSPSEFPMKDDVLKSVFSMETGESSTVMEDKKGGYFVVRVDDVKPSHVRAFDSIKNEVKQVWYQERRVLKAVEEAMKIVEEVKKGKSLASFESRNGVDVHMSKPIDGLGTMDKDLPSTAYGRILQMQKGDVIVDSAPDRQFVMRLVSMADVDPAKPDAGRIRLVDYLDNIAPYEIVDQYASVMRKAFPVKINETILASLRNRQD